jgi:hypothetical protein
MRLDVSVNLLTMQALTRGEITVLGGDQTRPNIHIEDITDLYLFLLDHPKVTGVYNAGRGIDEMRYTVPDCAVSEPHCCKTGNFPGQRLVEVAARVVCHRRQMDDGVVAMQIEFVGLANIPAHDG